MNCNHANRFKLGLLLMLLGAVVQPVLGDDINTSAGTGTGGYSGDGGQATSAQVNKPQGVGADSSGNIYIADTEN